MIHLLMIGGSGFFGKSLLDAFHRGLLKPWDIQSITIFARDADVLKRVCPHLLTPSISLINADIASCRNLPAAEYVIHAAASADASRYLLRPEEERTNILLAITNFAVLAKSLYRDSKIVYVSSGAVYGQQLATEVALSEEESLRSIDSLMPNKRDYAAAKRDGERVIEKLGREGFNVSIARCFAFIGPYLPLDQHFAIGNFIADGLKKNPVAVNAHQLVYRSYLDADDLVRWLITIAAHSSPAAPIFNVGSDQAVEIGELGQKIASYFNVPLVLSKNRLDTVDRYVPSISKAREHLGLAVSTNLDESIDKTVRQILNINQLES